LGTIHGADSAPSSGLRQPTNSKSKKGLIMKLLGRGNLKARAAAFEGADAWLVQLRMGGAVYVLETAEAVALATELVEAIDRARVNGGDGVSAEGRK
jgi:hypothetical protein